MKNRALFIEGKRDLLSLTNGLPQKKQPISIQFSRKKPHGRIHHFNSCHSDTNIQQASLKF